MKKIIAFFILFSILSACTNKRQEKFEEVNKAESQLFGNMNAPLDVQKAHKIISLYSSFANEYPDDTNSVKMMFKAAEVSMNIDKPQDAIGFLDSLMVKYPNSEYVPKALHLEGFIYDDKLHNIQMARISFESLIKRFPNHQLSQNAKDYMTTLGKTPEEIIKEFEEKNKAEK